MWDFCLRIECPQKLKPNIWICRGICTFGPTPTAKISQLFLLVFFGLLGLRFFPYFGQSHVLVEFYYPGKDEKDAPQLRNYSAATEILFT